MAIPETLWHDICVCAVLALKYGTSEDCEAAQRVNIWLDKQPTPGQENTAIVQNESLERIAAALEYLASAVQNGWLRVEDGRP